MRTTKTHSTDTAGTVAVVRTQSGLEARPIRRRDRLMVLLHSHSLDDELARGMVAEERWLRAVRASRLMATRAGLARDWDDLLARANSAAPTLSAAVPISRRAVRDAAEVIEELIAALQAPHPVDVRGLATASYLLSDGTGPVYRARSPEHLSAAVAGALGLLRTATTVNEWATDIPGSTPTSMHYRTGSTTSA